jgi:hypothetical protein
MKTWGIKVNGRWLTQPGGFMFWTVSRECAEAFRKQSNFPAGSVRCFEDEGDPLAAPVFGIENNEGGPYPNGEC